MSLDQTISLWKKAQNAKKAGCAEKLLTELGFKATTNNGGIHWKIREVDYSIDFWPTTERLQVIGSDGIKESIVGFENIVVKLVRLIIRRNDEN